jgi:ABC-2 type transport system ATP-binding protein
MAEDGVTVFVTTHYMDEAEYCGRLVLIYRGQIVASGSPSELKRGAMKDELLLLECDQLGLALEILQTGPGVLDAAIFGNSLHVVVRQAAAAIPVLTKYLSERGIAVLKIGPIRPTLEDVFVELTSRKEQPAGEGQVQ